MIGSGLQPDQRTFDLLIKAHIVNRDTKSAMETVNQMVRRRFFLTFISFIHSPRCVSFWNTSHHIIFPYAWGKVLGAQGTLSPPGFHVIVVLNLIHFFMLHVQAFVTLTHFIPPPTLHSLWYSRPPVLHINFWHVDDIHLRCRRGSYVPPAFTSSIRLYYHFHEFWSCSMCCDFQNRHPHLPPTFQISKCFFSFSDPWFYQSFLFIGRFMVF